MGRLAFKLEPAGKVRVFAMLDVWTQSILEPIHNHVFSILKQIPNDGCFDQAAPLKRLMAKKIKDIYSFDLSSATDRLPIDIQCQVLEMLYNKSIADAWYSILIRRPYFIADSELKKYPSDIIFDERKRVKGGFQLEYAVGQPMGALSS